MKLKYKNNMMLFGGAPTNVELFEIFKEESYSKLSLNDAVVIDNEGNIWDSAIYFAVNGAMRIISIELQQVSFNSMVENIKLNHLDDKIFTLLATSGSHDTFIEVGNKDAMSNGGNSLKLSKYRKIITIIILSNTVKECLSSDNNFLKKDCEKCEYDLIRNCYIADFRYLNQIVLEYHYGQKKMQAKIEEASFKVNVSKGIQGFDLKARPYFMNSGILVYPH
ncbi:MAG: hypothetical protein QXU18_16080 [Thermoplasmatales archaeon]